MRPGRVVAATSVNRGQLEPDRARRRSLAEHDVEVEVLERRIQHLLDRRAASGGSRRRTARRRRSRFVRIAARSLGRSSAGPLVGWNPAPISFATIWASVVLPSPGGPLNSRWSTASPRRRAPSIRSASCSFTRSCPTNSRERRRAEGDVELAVLGVDHGGLDQPVVVHQRSTVAQRPPSGAPRAAGPRPRGRRPRRRRAPRWPPAGVSRARAAPRARPRAGPSTTSSPSPPKRSRRSSTTRWATFLPTPGTTVSASASPATTARRSASGDSADRNESATFGPTPRHAGQQVEQRRARRAS